jgi:hypothetical protein
MPHRSEARLPMNRVLLFADCVWRSGLQRWWLVECDSAEAGQRIIEAGQLENRVDIGRILDSGTNPPAS